ncbi:hypothetical protein ACSS6W_005105 [Trichoderma asperelloides]
MAVVLGALADEIAEGRLESAPTTQERISQCKEGSWFESWIPPAWSNELNSLMWAVSRARRTQVLLNAFIA